MYSGYLELTLRCRMSCSHCCVSAGPRRSETMSTPHALKALELFVDDDAWHDEATGYVTLGGGEPTLHPDFFQILGYGLALGLDMAVVTSGTETESALRLARLARRGMVSASLSQDLYHAKSLVDPRVVEAFTKTTHYGGGQGNDLRSIRGADPERIVRIGRAARKKIGTVPQKRHCICDSIIVRHDGTIRACGCDNAPVIGRIDQEEPISPEWRQTLDSDEFKYGDCWNVYLRQKAAA